jgi:uroporphyrinogen decarboxylase
MTHKETVIAALNHQETMPIPFTIYPTIPSMEKLIQYTGDPGIEKKIGSYIVKTGWFGGIVPMKDKPGFFTDDFGIVWDRSGVDKDIGQSTKIVIADPDKIKDYKIPKIDETKIRTVIEDFIKSSDKDCFLMMVIGWSMFERSWLLMGMENVLTYMITNPDELDDFYDRNCGYLLKIVDIALGYKEIDGVYFGDDWGQQKGMIMGPRHWRRFVKPRMARLYDRVKSKGKYTLQHCCGDVKDIFPDLIEIGLDCFQTFQPEIYDIVEMKRIYGGSIAFWGGISTQKCLPWMTPEQVKKEITRVVKIMRPQGGFIAAPTHAVPYDVPPENIVAMMDVFHNQEE